MALNLDKIKSRLNSLSNNNNKSNLLWKPTPGKQVVRIVPYKFDPENPFIELYFHYNLNGKTFLSPDTYNRPDPIVEFANKLKGTGNKEDWSQGRALSPKMRTYVPVIVRGEEGLGVRFWGFGKQVYQELMGIVLDEDNEWGDITDLKEGRDIVVEFKTAKETGRSYPETSIRVKLKTSTAVDPKDTKMLDMLTQQTNITELFPEPTYDELKSAMESHLSTEDDEDVVSESVDSPSEESDAKVASTSSKPKASSDVSDAFDELFNG
jgi:hypothetical protein